MKFELKILATEKIDTRFSYFPFSGMKTVRCKILHYSTMTVVRFFGVDILGRNNAKQGCCTKFPPTKRVSTAASQQVSLLDSIGVHAKFCLRGLTFETNQPSIGE